MRAGRRAERAALFKLRRAITACAQPRRGQRGIRGSVVWWARVRPHGRAARNALSLN